MGRWLLDRFIRVMYLYKETVKYDSGDGMSSFLFLPRNRAKRRETDERM